MVSAGILAILGVDHLALIWGFIGALGGMTLNPPTVKGRAVILVFVSTMLGAAFGTLLADRFDAPNLAVRIVCSAICAAGAQQILPLAVSWMMRRLERIFGKDE